MSQFTMGDMESPLSGTTFINSKLEPWAEAVVSHHSGISRPSYAVEQMMWVDTSTTPWKLYMYDGADDILIGSINATTNAFSPAGVTLNNDAATTAPAVGDDSVDGYSVGSRWVNTTTDLVYMCVDASVGAAIWKQIVDTNSTQALSGKSFSSITVTGGSITGITDLAVADGGTGSSTAGGARTNLGAAASGANTDITSLTNTQTIPSGLVADHCGYLGAPVNASLTSGNYTLVATDAGKYIQNTSASARVLTIPANASVAFPVGTVLCGTSEGAAMTIQITTDTLRWGSSTGTRTVAQNGSWSLIKIATNFWRLTGDGIT